MNTRPLPHGLTALLLSLSSLLAAPGCGNRSVVPPPGQAAPSSSAQTPVASKADGGALFAEVSQAAGLNYRWQIEGKRPLTILQTIGNGCAFLDYDQDGNLDILLVGPHLALYHNVGNREQEKGKRQKAKGKREQNDPSSLPPSFEDVTHETGLDTLSGHFLGCAVGDYDNDGFPDIYLTAYRGGTLLRNTEGEKGRKGERETKAPSPLLPFSPSRLFRDVTQAVGLKPQPWGTSAAFVDVDNDGYLDLYLGNYVIFSPNTQPQLCEYSGYMSSCGPRFYQPEKGVLYHNEGSGRFRDVSKAWGVPQATGKALGVACADFDGSGRQSFALANDEVAGDLLQNLGKKFENIGAKSGTAYDTSGNVHGGMGIDWGDYDNDGKLDLVVATFQHETKCIYRNEGDGLFTERSAALGIAEKTAPNVAFGIKWLDYDNDGFLDLMIANGHVQDNIADIDKSTTYRQTTQLFRNVEGKTLEDVSAKAGPIFQKAIVGRGLAVGDYDNDGRVDALIVDSEGQPLLLHNETGKREQGTGKPHPSEKHWLSVQLRGTKSNRDGIGAVVRVEAGGIKQTRRCATDGSYMSASDRRVHVGLGRAAAATVTVRWPSGATNTYKNIAADRVVTLREDGRQE